MNFLGIRPIIGNMLWKFIFTFINRGFVSERIKLGFDESYLRSKLYDASVIMSEKQTKSGYEIVVRWSDKKRGEFYSLIKNRVN